MLDQLRDGDTVVVWKLDRLSRSLKDVLHLMERIAEAGADFRSVTENIDTMTPAGRMMMQMVGSFAEFARATRPSGARSQRASSPAASPAPTWPGSTTSASPWCHASSWRTGRPRPDPGRVRDQGRRPHASPEEAAALRRKPRRPKQLPPRRSRTAGSWRGSPKSRIALARKALAISPLCADAYNLLADEAATPAEARDLYLRGLEAGELALGPDGFQEYGGHFWGFLETRPYMRARQGLALTLQELGEDEAARGHFRAMLELNPNDNQGIRYLLLASLLRCGDVAGAKALLASYLDEWSAQWLYTRVLVAYRDSQAAEAAILEPRFRADASYRDTLGPMADEVGIVVDVFEIDG